MHVLHCRCVSWLFLRGFGGEDETVRLVQAVCFHFRHVKGKERDGISICRVYHGDE